MAYENGKLSMNDGGKRIMTFMKITHRTELFRMN